MSKITIVVHSGEFDKIMSALIIGNGYLAMGDAVTLFFTFWGLRALMKNGLKRLPLSRMNLFGMGAWMMKRKMKRAGVAGPQRLFKDFRELGGRVIACEMTMDVMGISRSSMEHGLIDEYGAVGMFVLESRESRSTLCI